MTGLRLASKRTSQNCLYRATISAVGSAGVGADVAGVVETGPVVGDVDGPGSTAGGLDLLLQPASRSTNNIRPAWKMAALCRGVSPPIRRLGSPVRAMKRPFLTLGSQIALGRRRLPAGSAPRCR